MDSKSLGTLIREERRRLGWTQQQMATNGGVSKSSQVGYEAGARPPDMRYLHNVCSAGCDSFYLLYGERQSTSGTDGFSWSTHDQLLRTIEDWLEQNRLTIRFEKKMDLLRLFMAHFAVVNRVDMAFVEETLANAA